VHLELEVSQVDIRILGYIYTCFTRSIKTIHIKQLKKSEEKQSNPSDWISGASSKRHETMSGTY